MELVNLIDEGHLFLDQQTKAPKYVIHPWWKPEALLNHVLQWPGKHHQNKIQSYIALFVCGQNPSSGLPAATISRDSNHEQNFPAPKLIKTHLTKQPAWGNREQHLNQWPTPGQDSTKRKHSSLQNLWKLSWLYNHWAHLLSVSVGH